MEGIEGGGQELEDVIAGIQVIRGDGGMPHLSDERKGTKEALLLFLKSI